MKKVLRILVLLFMPFCSLCQNVGIGTPTPSNSAMLEIKADDKGILLPRTSTLSRKAIVNPAKGLILYDTTSSSFWFHNGGAWVQIGASGNGWSLTGNSSTNPNNNFIGTVDEQSLVFKVNNLRAGLIDYSTYNSGTRNTAFGQIALNSVSSGMDNAATGYGALYSNSTGSFNAAFGKYALFNNNADNNTAYGFNTMFFNTTGTYNTATGSVALQNNTGGQQNTATGYAALAGNNNGNYNTATGSAALNSNNTAHWNTANGAYALYQNNADFNTANGGYSLYTNNSGSANTANGFKALYNNSTGEFNTAIGYYSLINNMVGNYNVGVGYNALYANWFGNKNTALGYNATVGSESLNNATAIGAHAIVLGDNSLVLGSIKGYNNAPASTNIGIGTPSPKGPLHVHSESTSNLFTDNTTVVLDDSLNTPCIRFHGTGNYSNAYFKITTRPYTSGSFRYLELRFGSPILEPVLSLSSGGSATLNGTLTQGSDIRLKTNILPLRKGLSSVLQLKAYTYQWKDMRREQDMQIGLIAQEVSEVLPDLVKADDIGMLSVNYVGIIPVLINGMKEQQQQIETLKEENLKMREEMRKIMKIIAEK